MLLGTHNLVINDAARGALMQLYILRHGIAFDASHGTHTSLTGERHFVTPDEPGWASPEGKWDDARIVGRDKRRFGPLPREWAHYEGVYLNGNKVVIA